LSKYYFSQEAAVFFFMVCTRFERTYSVPAAGSIKQQNVQFSLL